MKYLILLILLFSCGEFAVVKNEPEEKNEDKVLDEKIKFFGYIIKGMTIYVDEQKFTDTENLFTEFKERLIYPNQPELKDAEIELENDYDVQTFGRNSPVFIAPKGDTGYVWQTTLDREGKFTIEANKTKYGIYNARIMIKISLKVTLPNQEPKKYCWNLNANMYDVEIGSAALPLIFNTYESQLNAWKCSDDSNDKFIIPIKKEPEEKEETPATSDNEEEMPNDIEFEATDIAIDASDIELQYTKMDNNNITFQSVKYRGKVEFKEITLINFEDIVTKEIKELRGRHTFNGYKYSTTQVSTYMNYHLQICYETDVNKENCIRPSRDFKYGDDENMHIEDAAFLNKKFYFLVNLNSTRYIVVLDSKLNFIKEIKIPREYNRIKGIASNSDALYAFEKVYDDYTQKTSIRMYKVEIFL